jgi:lipid A 3-O-deacylase
MVAPRFQAQKVIGAFTILLSGVAGVSKAQWSGATIYNENDSFVLFGGADKFYTQGYRLVFARDPGKTWRFASALHGLFEDPKCDEPGHDDCNYQRRSSLVVGQTIETPELITSFRQNPADRPFAAYVYGGVRADIVRLDKRHQDSSARHSFEVTIGFLGPPALGKPSQKGFHVLRHHRIPKGWDFELGTEPQLDLRYAFERRFLWGSVRSPIEFDFTPIFSAAIGTLQTYPAAGATIRLGYHLSGFPQTVIVPTVMNAFRADLRNTIQSDEGVTAAEGTVTPDPPRNFEIAVFAGADARYFLRNAYLDGNLLRGSPSDVRRRSYVNDFRFGLTLRYRPLRLTYTHVLRSAEFKPSVKEGRHAFGSLAADWEPSFGKLLPRGRLCWCATDWQFDVGMGAGITRFSEARTWSATRNGPTGRIAIIKGATRLFTVGWEYVGGVQEGGPPNGFGVHHDTFLLATVGTIGVRPFGPRHPLHVRFGLGKATAKRELTCEGEPCDVRTEAGRAYTASLEYLFRLGNPLSFGLNTTWGYLKVDKSLFGTGQFVASNVTLRWFPLGRWH